MVAVHLSEQFLRYLVIGAINMIETLLLLAVASLFFMIFIQNFSKQLKNKKRFRAYLLMMMLLLGIYLVSYALPSKGHYVIDQGASSSQQKRGAISSEKRKEDSLQERYAPLQKTPKNMKK